LTRAGHKVTVDSEISETDRSALIPSLDAWISGRVTAQDLERAPMLRLVVSPAIGVDGIAIAAATERGILVCNSPSPANAIGVAEATIGLILALNKRMHRKESRLRNGAWSFEGDRTHLLSSSTIGLVGLGRIGREVARRLMPWGTKVLGHDPYVEDSVAHSVGVTAVTLRVLLAEADFVSLHVIANAETTRMIGPDELNLMKPTANLINTSRGALLDERAFCQAVQRGVIAGGALDVFEREPLDLESPLRELDPDRVILTPHSISHSLESKAGNRELALESTILALSGSVPKYVVNEDAIPAWRTRFGGKS
jgi:phosphoglycerate dehydrogenase-like enzyme